MHLSGTVKAQTYNVFGSLKGWGVSPMSSPDKQIRSLFGLNGFENAKKLHEWQCLDTIKAIGAQQQAALVYIDRAIWRKYPRSEVEKQRIAWLRDKQNSKRSAFKLFPKCSIQMKRERLFQLARTNPTADNWLHRVFRREYQRGHTRARNQIVYQKAGYKCRRLTRNTIELVVNGLSGKKR